MGSRRNTTGVVVGSAMASSSRNQSSRLLVFAAALLAVALLVQADPVPVEKSRLRALHVPKEKFQWKKFLVLPNTYYDHPRNRYPYYDQRGVGKNVYGYGGQTLYKYDTFQPLEGFFR